MRPVAGFPAAAGTAAGRDSDHDSPEPTKGAGPRAESSEAEASGRRDSTARKVSLQQAERPEREVHHSVDTRTGETRADGGAARRAQKARKALPGRWSRRICSGFPPPDPPGWLIAHSSRLIRRRHSCRPASCGVSSRSNHCQSVSGTNCWSPWPCDQIPECGREVIGLFGPWSVGPAGPNERSVSIHWFADV